MREFKTMNSRSIAFLFLLISLAWVSCNDQSIVGSELVDQDGFEVVFTDSVTLIANTILDVDSIQTNSPDLRTTDLFLGEVNDPVIGTKKFDAYMQVKLGSVAPSFYDYNNEAFATIDSIVLVINMDTTLFYGDKLASHDIEVFQIDQEFEEDIELYNNQELNTLMTPVGDLQSITPSFENFELKFLGDSSITRPSIRLRLNDDFGQMILNDTAAVKLDSSFQNLVNGFKLTSSSSNSSLLPLDMLVTQLTDVGNKMLIYYTDTIPKAYSFVLGGVRHSYLDSDKTGSLLESAYNNLDFSDSLVVIDGFGSADMWIQLPSINSTNFSNILVKKAELEITLADLAGDDELFEAIPLLVAREDDDDDKSPINDVFLAEFEGSYTAYFGGNVRVELDDNDEIIRSYYKLNITSHFISLMQQNSTKTDNLYIGALVPRLSPGRSVIYGPGNSTYPMKLNLTYSIPN